MDMNSFFEAYQAFQWVFSLGYVVVLSIIATILLVKLERITILKNALSGANEMQKDSILGFAGTVTSLVVFTVFHFANEMILQGKFLIDFDTTMQSITIPGGAAIVWSSSKGIYTVLHKWWARVKAGEVMNWRQFREDIKNEIEKGETEVKKVKEVKLTKKDKKALKVEKKTEIAKVKKAAKAKARKDKAKRRAEKKGGAAPKKVINKRTNGEV